MQWRGNILPVIYHGLKGEFVYFDFASQWSSVPKALLELRLSEAVRGTGSKPGIRAEENEATLTPEAWSRKAQSYDLQENSG